MTVAVRYSALLMESGTNQDEAVWKLTLSYDGSDFHGWQVQPALRTVQGELAAAIARLTGETVLPQGSGRTDAGVHALGQVASFPLRAPIPAASLMRALNRTLPSSVRILSAERAGPGFHARHSATAKSYEYRIFRGEICPPWLARYVYAFPQPLQVDAMRRAAALVCGRHDFASFAANDGDLAHRQADPVSPGRGTTRTIFESAWATEGDLLLYRVRGDGFLHHMVRNLVGTFLDVGRGHLAPEKIPEVLAARRRTCAGPTAPARGLFLVSVEYGPMLP